LSSELNPPDLAEAINAQGLYRRGGYDIVAILSRAASIRSTALRAGNRFHRGGNDPPGD
jgi:hypothetical protein